MKYLLIIAFLTITISSFTQSKIPNWLIGQWKGEVSQPKGTIKSYGVKVICDSNCTVEYNDLGCSGLWKPIKTSKKKVVFTEIINKGEDKCLTGIKVIITNKKGSLLYRVYDDKGTRADCKATLHKQ